jgi:hypothetical protein
VGKAEGKQRADKGRCCPKETTYVSRRSKQDRRGSTAEMGEGQSLAEEGRVDIRFPYIEKPANPIEEKTGFLPLRGARRNKSRQLSFPANPAALRSIHVPLGLRSVRESTDGN